MFAYDDSVGGVGDMRRVWMKEVARPRQVSRKMPRQAWMAEQECRLKQAVIGGEISDGWGSGAMVYRGALPVSAVGGIGSDLSKR